MAAVGWFREVLDGLVHPVRAVLNTNLVVPAQGFEPWTIGLKDRCSAKLSYAGTASIRIRSGLEMGLTGSRRQPRSTAVVQQKGQRAARPRPDPWGYRMTKNRAAPKERPDRLVIYPRASLGVHRCGGHLEADTRC